MAVGLVAALLIQDVAWAGVDGASLQGLRITGGESAAPGSDAVRSGVLAADPSRMRLPFKHCFLTEAYAGTSGRLVIHIQDAHANFAGQKNLAAVIEDLARRYGVNLVLGEGGEGPMNLDRLKPLASARDWKVIARRLLQDGAIVGEEELNLATDLPIRIVGVEDWKLYEEAVRAYRRIARLRPRLLDELRRVRAAIDRLKPRLYPQEILDYEKNASDWESRLELLSRSAGLDDLKDFPELAQIVELRRREKMFVFDRLALERDAFTARLTAVGADTREAEEIRGILERFGSSRSFAERAHLGRELLDLARSRGVAVEAYPEWAGYLKFVGDLDAVRMDAVFDQLDAAEIRMYRERLADDRARRLRAVELYADLLEKAYRVRMSNDEFRALDANRPDFVTKDWQGFLNAELLRTGADAEALVPFRGVMDRAYAAIDRFYDLADRRDRAFVDRATRELDAESNRSGFLVTGGYHTRNLTRLLRDQGVSYLVLTPITDEETDTTRYERLLLTSGSATTPSRSTLRQPYISAPGAGARLAALYRSGAGPFGLKVTLLIAALAAIGSGELPAKPVPSPTGFPQSGGSGISGGRATDSSIRAPGKTPGTGSLPSDPYLVAARVVTNIRFVSAVEPEPIVTAEYVRVEEEGKDGVKRLRQLIRVTLTRSGTVKPKTYWFLPSTDNFSTDPFAKPDPNPSVTYLDAGEHPPKPYSVPTASKPTGARLAAVDRVVGVASRLMVGGIRRAEERVRRAYGELADVSGDKAARHFFNLKFAELLFWIQAQCWAVMVPGRSVVGRVVAEYAAGRSAGHRELGGLHDYYHRVLEADDSGVVDDDGVVSSGPNPELTTLADKLAQARAARREAEEFIAEHPGDADAERDWLLAERGVAAAEARFREAAADLNRALLREIPAFETAFYQTVLIANADRGGREILRKALKADYDLKYQAERSVDAAAEAVSDRIIAEGQFGDWAGPVLRWMRSGDGRKEADALVARAAAPSVLAAAAPAAVLAAMLLAVLSWFAGSIGPRDDTPNTSSRAASAKAQGASPQGTGSSASNQSIGTLSLTDTIASVLSAPSAASGSPAVVPPADLPGSAAPAGEEDATAIQKQLDQTLKAQSEAKAEFDRRDATLADTLAQNNLAGTEKDKPKPDMAPPPATWHNPAPAPKSAEPKAEPPAPSDPAASRKPATPDPSLLRPSATGAARARVNVGSERPEHANVGLARRLSGKIANGKYLGDASYDQIDPITGEYSRSALRLELWNLPGGEEASIELMLPAGARERVIPIFPNSVVVSVQSEHAGSLQVWVDKEKRFWMIKSDRPLGRLKVGYREARVGELPPPGVLRIDPETDARWKDALPPALLELAELVRELPVEERYAVKEELMGLTMYTQNPLLEKAMRAEGNFVRHWLRRPAGPCDFLNMTNAILCHLFELPSVVKTGPVDFDRDGTYATASLHAYQEKPDGSVDEATGMVGMHSDLHDRTGFEKEAWQNEMRVIEAMGGRTLEEKISRLLEFEKNRKQAEALRKKVGSGGQAADISPLERWEAQHVSPERREYDRLNRDFGRALEAFKMRAIGPEEAERLVEAAWKHPLDSAAGSDVRLMATGNFIFELLNGVADRFPKLKARTDQAKSGVLFRITRARQEAGRSGPLREPGDAEAFDRIFDRVSDAPTWLEPSFVDLNPDFWGLGPYDLVRPPSGPSGSLHDEDIFPSRVVDRVTGGTFLMMRRSWRLGHPVTSLEKVPGAVPEFGSTFRRAAFYFQGLLGADYEDQHRGSYTTLMGPRAASAGHQHEQFSQGLEPVAGLSFGENWMMIGSRMVGYEFVGPEANKWKISGRPFHVLVRDSFVREPDDRWMMLGTPSLAEGIHGTGVSNRIFCVGPLAVKYGLGGVPFAPGSIHLMGQDGSWVLVGRNRRSEPWRVYSDQMVGEVETGVPGLQAEVDPSYNFVEIVLNGPHWTAVFQNSGDPPGQFPYLFVGSEVDPRAGDTTTSYRSWPVAKGRTVLELQGVSGSKFYGSSEDVKLVSEILEFYTDIEDLQFGVRPDGGVVWAGLTPEAGGARRLVGTAAEAAGEHGRVFPGRAGTWAVGLFMVPNGSYITWDGSTVGGPLAGQHDVTADFLKRVNIGTGSFILVETPYEPSGRLMWRHRGSPSVAVFRNLSPQEQGPSYEDVASIRHGIPRLKGFNNATDSGGELVRPEYPDHRLDAAWMRVRDLADQRGAAQFLNYWVDTPRGRVREFDWIVDRMMADPESVVFYDPKVTLEVLDRHPEFLAYLVAERPEAFRFVAGRVLIGSSKEDLIVRALTDEITRLTGRVARAPGEAADSARFDEAQMKHRTEDWARLEANLGALRLLPEDWARLLESRFDRLVRDLGEDKVDIRGYLPTFLLTPEARSKVSLINTMRIRTETTALSSHNMLLERLADRLAGRGLLRLRPADYEAFRPAFEADRAAAGSVRPFDAEVNRRDREGAAYRLAGWVRRLPEAFKLDADGGSGADGWERGNRLFDTQLGPDFDGSPQIRYGWTSLASELMRDGLVWAFVLGVFNWLMHAGPIGARYRAWVSAREASDGTADRHLTQILDADSRFADPSKSSRAAALIRRGMNMADPDEAFRSAVRAFRSSLGPRDRLHFDIASALASDPVPAMYRRTAWINWIPVAGPVAWIFAAMSSDERARRRMNRELAALARHATRPDADLSAVRHSFRTILRAYARPVEFDAADRTVSAPAADAIEHPAPPATAFSGLHGLLVDRIARLNRLAIEPFEPVRIRQDGGPSRRSTQASGNSVDDHRAYTPGDDIRSLDQHRLALEQMVVRKETPEVEKKAVLFIRESAFRGPESDRAAAVAEFAKTLAVFVQPGVLGGRGEGTHLKLDRVVLVRESDDLTDEELRLGQSRLTPAVLRQIAGWLEEKLADNPVAASTAADPADLDRAYYDESLNRRYRARNPHLREGDGDSGELNAGLTRRLDRARADVAFLAGFDPSSASSVRLRLARRSVHTRVWDGNTARSPHYVGTRLAQGFDAVFDGVWRNPRLWRTVMSGAAGENPVVMELVARHIVQESTGDARQLKSRELAKLMKDRNYADSLAVRLRIELTRAIVRGIRRSGQGNLERIYEVFVSERDERTGFFYAMVRRYVEEAVRLKGAGRVQDAVFLAKQPDSTGKKRSTGDKSPAYGPFIQSVAEAVQEELAAPMSNTDRASTSPAAARLAGGTFTATAPSKIKGRLPAHKFRIPSSGSRLAARTGRAGGDRVGRVDALNGAVTRIEKDAARAQSQTNIADQISMLGRVVKAVGKLRQNHPSDSNTARIARLEWNLTVRYIQLLHQRIMELDDSLGRQGGDPGPSTKLKEERIDRIIGLKHLLDIGIKPNTASIRYELFGALRAAGAWHERTAQFAGQRGKEAWRKNEWKRAQSAYETALRIAEGTSWDLQHRQDVSTALGRVSGLLARPGDTAPSSESAAARLAVDAAGRLLTDLGLTPFDPSVVTVRSGGRSGRVRQLYALPAGARLAAARPAMITESGDPSTAQSRFKKQVLEARRILVSATLPKWGEAITSLPIVVRSILDTPGFNGQIFVDSPYSELVTFWNDPRIVTVDPDGRPEAEPKPYDLVIADRSTAADAFAVRDDEENRRYTFDGLIADELFIRAGSRPIQRRAGLTRKQVFVESMRLLGLEAPVRQEIYERRAFEANSVLINPHTASHQGALTEKFWTRLILGLLGEGKTVWLSSGDPASVEDQALTRRIETAVAAAGAGSAAVHGSTGRFEVRRFASRTEAMRFLAEKPAFVVTWDTGLFHVAEAFGIPTVVYRHPNLSTYWVPEDRDNLRGITLSPDMAEDDSAVEWLLRRTMGALEFAPVMSPVGRDPMTIWDSIRRKSEAVDLHLMRSGADEVRTVRVVIELKDLGLQDPRAWDAWTDYVTQAVWDLKARLSKRNILLEVDVTGPEVQHDILRDLSPLIYSPEEPEWKAGIPTIFVKSPAADPVDNRLNFVAEPAGKGTDGGFVAPQIETSVILAAAVARANGDLERVLPAWRLAADNDGLVAAEAARVVRGEIADPAVRARYAVKAVPIGARLTQFIEFLRLGARLTQIAA